jgi:hypothetical protein
VEEKYSSQEIQIRFTEIPRKRDKMLTNFCMGIYMNTLNATEYINPSMFGILILIYEGNMEEESKVKTSDVLVQSYTKL